MSGDLKEMRELKSEDHFRNRISTVNSKGKRNFIFPSIVKGKFYKYRTYVSALLLLIFFGVPFIKINGHPLLLLNILERKFVIVGKVFWPQDFIIFLLSIITLIIFVLLFTVIYGRLFCGWACPQTVFMEMVFRKIEILIEGNHIQQRKLKDGPMNGEKIRKRILKIGAFLIVSLIIGNLAASYIVGPEKLFEIITSPPTQHLTGFIVVMAFSMIFFFDFYYFREQTCLVVCPYGRLQGVLLDKKSVVVAYDHKRGEPRELPKKTRNESAGDCIDCFKCVDVCPTGIDIRNGTQLECVNCTACIDACDEVMDKIGKPRGLVRFASEIDIETGKSFRFNARSISYSVVLAVLLGILSFLILTRPDVEATITKATGSLYTITPNNSIQNLYNITIANKTFAELPLEFKVSAEWNAKVQIIGSSLIAKPEAVSEAIFLLEIPREKLTSKSSSVEVELWSNDKRIDIIEVQFLRP